MLGFLIGILSTLFTALVKGTPLLALALVFVVSGSSSFMLMYLTVEFLIFREINAVYNLLEKIRKKDFKKMRKTNEVNFTLEPISKISDELFMFARDKEAEIDELKRNEAARRDFFADISHELKTPIFAAQGFVETLLDGAVDDDTVKYHFLKKADESLDNLRHLVEDILDLSKLEAGVITMDMATFDIVRLVRDTIDQLEGKLNSRQMKLVLDTNNLHEILVKADRNRIRQALNNLIDNAIKYGTVGGSVFVSIEPDKKTVKVTVADDGPGIPEESLGRIFDRFYRVEKSRTKKMGGSGLGLAIVKQIIEAHGFKISVESKIGVGTKFRFKLKKFRPKSEEDDNTQDTNGDDPNRQYSNAT